MRRLRFHCAFSEVMYLRHADPSPFKKENALFFYLQCMRMDRRISPQKYINFNHLILFYGNVALIKMFKMSCVLHTGTDFHLAFWVAKEWRGHLLRNEKEETKNERLQRLLYYFGSELVQDQIDWREMMRNFTDTWTINRRVQFSNSLSWVGTGTSAPQGTTELFGSSVER